MTHPIDKAEKIEEGHPASSVQLIQWSEGGLADGAPLAWLISPEIGYFLEPALFVSRI